MNIQVKRNFGERVTEISDNLNIPKATVESVLREYLDDLTESAKNGETVIIDNIMSIKVLEENGTKKLRGRVSPALKWRVNE